MKQQKKTLQELITALPRELEPQRNLWPGIDHAINTPAQAAATYKPFALAASVLLICGLSLFYGLRQPVPRPIDPAIEDYISNLQQQHRLSKQAVLVEFQQQQPMYPQWEEQLHQLEQAENVVYQALRRDPYNRELLSILYDVQAKQLKLIDAVFAPQFNAI